MAVTVEAKFPEMGALTADLTNGIGAPRAREQMVEHVAGQGEGIIADFVVQVDAGVPCVASPAKSLDGTHVVANGSFLCYVVTSSCGVTFGTMFGFMTTGLMALALLMLLSGPLGLRTPSVRRTHMDRAAPLGSVNT